MRSLRPLFFLCLLTLFVGASWAAFSADAFIAQFQAKQATLSLAEKKTYYAQVYSNLSLLAFRNRNDAEQAKLFATLKDYVSAQMKNLGSGTSSPSSTVSSGMNIPKVDLVKVRAAWLALHNSERKNTSLTPFTYSSALEWTATTWAKHLADIGKANHLRKSTDGYYSYTSIKQRFIDLWIAFAAKEKNGAPLFTENLWRGYYTCKKTDCTDDFIKAIKTSRTFFMSEKGKKSKPHYNAIVGNFTTIGLGVAVTGNKYYLVSHYTQALK